MLRMIVASEKTKYLNNGGLYSGSQNYKANFLNRWVYPTNWKISFYHFK